MPKNTGINAHIHLGREETNRRKRKALFLISANKQLEGKLVRDLPQGSRPSRGPLSQSTCTASIFSRFSSSGFLQII